MNRGGARNLTDSRSSKDVRCAGGQGALTEAKATEGIKVKHMRKAASVAGAGDTLFEYLGTAIGKLRAAGECEERRVIVRQAPVCAWRSIFNRKEEGGSETFSQKKQK